MGSFKELHYFGHGFATSMRQLSDLPGSSVKTYRSMTGENKGRRPNNEGGSLTASPRLAAHSEWQSHKEVQFLKEPPVDLLLGMCNDEHQRFPNNDTQATALAFFASI